MNVINADARLRVVHALCEGNAINAVVRQTGVAKTTILRLLARLGEGCARLHNRLVRGLSCTLIQCDEIWSYVGKKGSSKPLPPMGTQLSLFQSEIASAQGGSGPEGVDPPI